jgi:hypothetical protein
LNSGHANHITSLHDSCNISFSERFLLSVLGLCLYDSGHANHFYTETRVGVCVYVCVCEYICVWIMRLFDSGHANHSYTETRVGVCVCM